jgi:DNA-binding response OmpR family regulator
MNILLIEDDLQLNHTIKKFLTKNHIVTAVFDGENAIELIDKKTYELYIIDINIPSINGLDLTTYVRKKDFNAAIVIITASTELNNFEDAFKNGCNEFIRKPFYLEELNIRINNLFDNRFEEDIEISSNIKYNTKNRELFIDNIRVNLRKKEKRLLELLLRNINFTVLTETIQNYVWENEIKDYYPVRQLINELRKKFNTGEKFIFTEKAIGYKFEIKK